MTLNSVMAVFCVISATSVAFSAHCVKVVEDIPNFLRQNIAQRFYQSINQSINIRLLRHDKTHANNVKRRNANNIQIIIYKKQQCQIDEGNV